MVNVSQWIIILCQLKVYQVNFLKIEEGLLVKKDKGGNALFLVLDEILESLGK